MADGTDDAGEVFAFTAEHDALREAVRRYGAQHFSPSALRDHVDSGAGHDAGAWQRLAALGVLGLGVPEELGGAGGTLVDQAVAVEELGAVLAWGPLVGTVFQAVPLLVGHPGEVRDDLLPDLCAGARTAAVAVADRRGALDPSRATATDGPDGWTASGDLGPVPDAGEADVLLVAATSPDGPVVLAVDAAGTGVRRTPLVTLDLTRPQAAAVLDEAPARLVVGPADAEPVVRRALQVAGALLAAEQVGGAQHVLDLSVAHAATRLQFGRPVGSFQAVKHRLADALVAVEHARSAAYQAAWVLAGRDEMDDERALVTAVAQATCSTAFSRTASDAVQVHGGTGFTWEHPAHLYLKRAAADAALLGGAEVHRERVATLVLDRAVADGVPAVATGRP